MFCCWVPHTGGVLPHPWWAPQVGLPPPSPALRGLVSKVVCFLQRNGEAEIGSDRCLGPSGMRTGWHHPGSTTHQAPAGSQWVPNLHFLWPHWGQGQPEGPGCHCGRNTEVDRTNRFEGREGAASLKHSQHHPCCYFQTPWSGQVACSHC